jgi:bifunctional enzyme CysN/CysC
LASLSLDVDVDARPGDLVADARSRPEIADQLAATIVWLGEQAMLPGRRYVMALANRTTVASITDIKHAVEMSDFGRIPATILNKGDIGVCNLALSEALAFDAFAENPSTGCFVLRDRANGDDVGIGFIQFALRRATNIQIQRIDIDKRQRAAIKQQAPVALWFTGLSGAGKTTVANLLEQRLIAQGRHTYLLDGDNLRHGLNKDLGFKPADRVENIRRVGEVARLMLDAGLIVMVSLISPFRSERQMVRELLQPGEFIEIYVNASLDTCRRRDPKGLYKKADAGLIANFTGISSPYEPPLSPEIILQSDSATPDELADQVLRYLDQRRPQA